MSVSSPSREHRHNAPVPHGGLPGDTDTERYVAVKYFAAACPHLCPIAGHSDTTDVAGRRSHVSRAFANWTVDIDLSVAAEDTGAVLARHEIGPLAGFQARLAHFNRIARLPHGELVRGVSHPSVITLRVN